AEEPWKLLAQTRVDALERVLEARAGLAVDAPHGFGERIERRREIGELAIEIFLALALIAQLIDRGEVHRAESLDIATRVGELLLPGGHIRVRRKLRLHARELAAGLRELLGERRAPHVRLLRSKA